MRALGDTDAYPTTDKGLLQGSSQLAAAGTAAALGALAEEWRPWRAYAAQHLWATAGEISATPNGR
jgi:AraC family transcriptional regulator of adaptative response / DNA-3-methyladenine glycosylase II